MLVIGHRGAAGLAPENTLESLHAGIASGADMLEFDVRLTSDNVPILCHDASIYGKNVRKSTLNELKFLGEITTLREVLDEFFGTILLNLEYKPNSDIDVIANILKTEYVKRKGDWENIIISSFRVRTLSRLRELCPYANIALLHSINPLAFVTYHRRLRLSAVGWHRLHVNSFATSIAHKAGLFTYVYTVNRPKAAILMSAKGIDGVVTDYPDRVAKALRQAS